jgi:hypothetical protein
VVVARDDAGVGDGDAEYVLCEIAEHGVVTLAPMVDVDDPLLLPGDLDEGAPRPVPPWC